MVSNTGDRLLFIHLPPGEYRVIPYYEIDDKTFYEYEVIPGTINLFPCYFAPSTWSQKFNELSPGMIENISDDLPTYIGFSDWVGKKVTPYKNFRLRRGLAKDTYTLAITSQPAGATIIIDGEERGITPAELRLPSGPHDMVLALEGFSESPVVLSMDSDKKLNVELKKQIESIDNEERKKSRSDQYRIGIRRFKHLQGDEGLLYRDLLADTLEIVLNGDNRIWADTIEVSLKEMGGLLLPDWDAAGAEGYDFIVDGVYEVTDEAVYIRANLLDVRKKSIKTGIAYSGEGGFNIFASVDDMANSFMAEVDKVLPEEGKTALSAREQIDVEVTNLKKEVTDRELIDLRMNHPHTLSVTMGVYGRWDNIESNDGYLIGQYKGDYPFGVRLNYDYNFLQSIGLSVSASYVGSTLDLEDGEKNNTSELAFSIGPKFSIPDLRNELYIKLLPQFLYADPVDTVLWELPPEMNRVRSIGPYFYLGGLVDFGLNAFLSNKADDTTSLINIGFLLDIIEARFSGNFTFEELITFGGGFYFGFGGRF